MSVGMLTLFEEGSELLDGLRITRMAVERTVRLVSTAVLRPPVLAPLVPDDMLDALVEIEGATSGRLNGQWRGTTAMSADEFVYGVPCASFINATFAYSKPRCYNRFSGDGRGAWYAALDVQTSLAEVGFHLAEELANIGEFKSRVEYAELHASFAGDVVDLVATPDHPALAPDVTAGYPVGNAIAEAALAKGVHLIRYPSVRHQGGVCFAAISPHAIQSVVPGALWSLSWDGSPEPTITKLAKAA
ncbi:MAG: RES family NAD+ phosphorylase [Sphingobium sp.]